MIEPVTHVNVLYTLENRYILDAWNELIDVITETDSELEQLMMAFGAYILKRYQHYTAEAGRWGMRAVSDTDFYHLVMDYLPYDIPPDVIRGAFVAMERHVESVIRQLIAEQHVKGYTLLLDVDGYWSSLEVIDYGSHIHTHSPWSPPVLVFMFAPAGGSCGIQPSLF